MRSNSASARSAMSASAASLTPHEAATVAAPGSTEATATSAPARRSTSAVMTASMGSVPLATGSSTCGRKRRSVPRHESGRADAGGKRSDKARGRQGEGSELAFLGAWDNAMGEEEAGARVRVRKGGEEAEVLESGRAETSGRVAIPLSSRFRGALPETRTRLDTGRVWFPFFFCVLVRKHEKKQKS
jgi:hypothetical protein